MAELNDHPGFEVRALDDSRETQDAFRRETARRVDGIIHHGEVNWIGEFELNNNGSATTTVVEDDRVSLSSHIALMPLTSAAAGQLAAIWIGEANLEPGLPWAGNKVGRFTINHPALSAGPTYKYRYAIKG